MAIIGPSARVTKVTGVTKVARGSEEICGKEILSSTNSITSSAGGPAAFRRLAQTRRFTQKGLQICVENLPASIREVQEAEGLHPSLCRPHGEKHLRLASHRIFAKVKNQLHLELLVQRFFQMNDPTRNRKLMERRSYRTTIRQPHQRQHRPTQLHAKRTVGSFISGA